MYEIPLFPLNTVLFPGMPLPLHIFEERYKEMISYCVKEKEPFGVVLVKEGEVEYDTEAKPYAIGCTAEIAQVQPLDDGRMMIMTVGKERFRIIELKHDKPYLVGVVQAAPLAREDEIKLADAADLLHPLVTDYLDILARAGDVKFDIEQIPSDAESLVYLAATLIQLPQEEKQNLLAVDKATILLRRLYQVYSREVSLMRWMPESDQGMFSAN